VPFPAAVDDHQTANAKPMEQAGAAIIVDERDLTVDKLAGILKDWLSGREALGERAIKARSQARPDALSRITNVCLEAAGVVA